MKAYKHNSEELTPEELGTIFADMPSDEQARFFNGVATATAQWPQGRGYGYGEMQWCRLFDEMRREPSEREGLAVIQSMSTFALLHAWDEQDKRERRARA